MTTIHTVLVCDDHQELRAVLRDVLAEVPNVKLVGETKDAIGCLDRVRDLRPDILLLDYRIPHGGAQVAKTAKALNPGMHIIVFSGRNDPGFRRDMIEAGADQYVVKTGRLQPLLDSLGRAFADLDNSRTGSLPFREN